MCSNYLKRYSGTRSDMEVVYYGPFTKHYCSFAQHLRKQESTIASFGALKEPRGEELADLEPTSKRRSE